MRQKRTYEAPLAKRIIALVMAIMLVLTMIPGPATAAPEEPMVLPIYVGMDKFSHTGGDANVSTDGTRVLNIPGRNNAATTSNGKLRVVPATGGASGIVVRTNKIKLEGGFSTYFVMNLHGGTSSPADGLTFIIQDNPTPVIGQVGIGVGYAGIPNSIGVEFDIWHNTEGGHQDINANHVAIVTNGKNRHTSDENGAIDRTVFKLHGETVHIWVDYDANGLVTASYGKTADRTKASTLKHNVGNFLTNKDVFVGFGASTGGSTANHDILAWYFKDSYVLGGLKPDGNYKQGPSTVTAEATPEGDGLDIRVKGSGADVNLPNERVSITINGKVIPGEHVTDSEGKLRYKFDDTSGLKDGENVITVVTHNGGTSVTKSFVQSVALNPEDVIANATDHIVTIEGEQAGSVVAVYKENGDFVAEAAADADGTVMIDLANVGDYRLSVNEPILVKIARSGEFKSNATRVTPKVRSDILNDDNNIFANATRDVAQIDNVPNGAIVRVYDALTNVKLGEAKQTEETGTLIVPLQPIDLADLQMVKLTIQEEGELESYPTNPDVQAKLETSAAPVNPIANADKDTISVKSVPSGARVIVYDLDGDELASEVNRTGASSVVEISMRPSDIRTQDEFMVSIHEVNKYESVKVSTLGQQQSQALEEDDVQANATTDTVHVSDVSVGTVVRVYNMDGKLIGVKEKDGGSAANITVEIDEPGLADGENVSVTVQTMGHIESYPVGVTASFDTTAAPANVQANATKDEVVVKDVPEGATVKVYDTNGENLIGTIVSKGGQTAVPVAGLEEADELFVTVTELNKYESEQVAVTAVEQTSPLNDEIVEDIVTDVIKEEVAVPNVPLNSIVTVYDKDGNELGKGTNPGPKDPGDVVIKPVIVPPGTNIFVTITDKDKLESERVEVAVNFEQSAPVKGDVRANATTDTVTVEDVPAGATVTVYKKDTKVVIGTATNNNQDSVQEVEVEISSGLDVDQIIIVTITEPRKAESDGLEFKAVSNPSEELDPKDIVANATDDTVSVRNVPPGGTITVYDGEDPIGEATNNNDTVDHVIVNVTRDLEAGDTLSVTIKRPKHGESLPINVEAKEESNSLDEDNLAFNGTTGELTVSDVPVGATIIVYDSNGNELGKGTKTDDGTDELILDIIRMNPGSTVQVTITLKDELESNPTVVIPTFEQSKAPGSKDVSANASKDAVTVINVPTGATVKVYDATKGNEIGTETNNDNGKVKVTIPAGLVTDQNIYVTITEPYKTESERSEEVAAVNVSSGGLGSDSITANATDNEVTVRDVPPGATINVYAKDSDIVIGTVTNNGATEEDFVIPIDPALTVGQKIEVTIKLPKFNESAPVEVTVLEQTDKSEGPLDDKNKKDIIANGTDRKLTVPNVPPGSTIIVYDKDGNELGRGEGNANGTVEIDLNGLDPDSDTVKVTIQETGKLESKPVVVPLLPSASPSNEDENLVADATTDTVTVPNVPPGATVTVYDSKGEIIGQATNKGTENGPLSVDIEGGLEPDQEVKVTINELYKSESEPTTVTAGKNDGAGLNPRDVAANTETNKVIVRDVPPGATITVYDSKGVEIGKATNNGTEAKEVEVTIDEPHKLGNGNAETIQVSITRKDANESDKIEVTPTSPSGKLTVGKVKASSSTSTVTVVDVPVGAEVYVYDANGNLIGKGTGGGTTASTLIIDTTPKLTRDQKIFVSIREDGKLESEKLEVTVVIDQTVAPLLSNLKANATTSMISVAKVPAGATARIYDETGKLIATRKNTTASSLDFEFHVTPSIGDRDEFNVSLQETGKTVSERVLITALPQSAPPTSSNVDFQSIDVSKDTVTIGNVPPGTTVTIYDNKGKKIGEGTNRSGETNDVAITDVEIVTTEITVTFTEPNKHESDPLVIDIALNTNEAIDDALRRLSVGFTSPDTWESVTEPVFGVTAGAHDTEVAWSSSKQNIIEITTPVESEIKGLVHRQANDESVILTATVSKNGVSKSRTFLLNVMAAGLTKEVSPGVRQIDVTNGEDDAINKVGIDRVLMTNGLKIDKVIFDAIAAGVFTGTDGTSNGISSIYVNELPGDAADEFAIEIPRQSVELLNGNGNSLEIRTDYGILTIAAGVLGDMKDSFLDLFFRLIPLKDENRQEALNRSIPSESVVRSATAGKIVEVLGSSMTIETNYSGYSTTLVIPFAKNGIVLPTSNVESFLSSLRVYIEHSDGEKVVRTGTIVNKDGVPFGISIDIDKFSTFSIIKLTDVPYTGTPQVPAKDGKEQIKTTTVDPKAGTIVLELDKSGYNIDKSGFTVTIGGKAAEIEEVSIDGSKVAIKLKDGISAGYEAIVSYKGAGAFIGSLASFEQLTIANPAHHEAYVNGFPDGTFRPQNTITRAEMAAMLARNKGLEDGSAYQGLYPDVAAGFWAASYIEQLKELGLLVGDDKGNFRPSDRITRAEMAMIAARWLGADLSVAKSSSFADVSSNHWAATAIAIVSEAGIMIGFEDGSFGTNDLLTRAQAVTIINRLLGRGPLTGVTDPTWPDVPSTHWAYEQVEEASQDHDYLYLPNGEEKLYQEK
ncbi:S-layer homology domain-containing protein [Paenibacillus sp. PAMC21692]|uniref:S-layer homology domain-containing protein n=1 Tax=Paenibacillus sp. PAMC21692 TaxID=2762320 RepID=UPI00164E307F|nr:S-layer homology domain-containing protein [Paenibacillus sp. PAMC21692]QNK56383.1 S-layer homology domain-containing protein [Paenibacillus sp. PAMC21692]